MARGRENPPLSGGRDWLLGDGAASYHEGSAIQRVVHPGDRVERNCEPTTADRWKLVDTGELGGGPNLTGVSSSSEAEGAVEALLEEVGEETQEQPLVHFDDLRGRTAIVSGGASGIGRRTALEFGRCGANVAFCWLEMAGRSIEEEAASLELELQQMEVKALSARLDVRDGEAVQAFATQVGERLGGPHYLVNAAGVHCSAPLWRMTSEEWARVIDVNLTGSFNMIRAVAPTYRKQLFGKIVNVASIHAFEGHFGVANYAASKSGIVGLTRSAAVELGPSNVNVNAVAPGFVQTGMLRDVPEAVVEDARERAALGRQPEARDVAGVILFLCSELARQITGQVIKVDAGLLA